MFDMSSSFCIHVFCICLSMGTCTSRKASVVEPGTVPSQIQDIIKTQMITNFRYVFRLQRCIDVSKGDTLHGSLKTSEAIQSVPVSIGQPWVLCH